MIPPMLTWKTPEPLLQGVDRWADGVRGRWRRRGSVTERLRRDAAGAGAYERGHRELSDPALRERLREFREVFRRGGRAASGEVVPALAALREAADRTLGLRPFEEQLMGALALHGGFLAEMATGEGKTLTAGLAGILAAWSGRPVHLITVNDYLVERDAAWLRPLFEFAQVRVGTVTASMAPSDRRHGYGAEVTYATGKELLADFLRDRLVLGEVSQPVRRRIRDWLSPGAARSEGARLVMRGLHHGLVDEADSVLIDEAVTPLMISVPRSNVALREAVLEAEQLVSTLEPGVDYRVDERHRDVVLTEAGEARLEGLCLGRGGVWRGRERRVELARQALLARECFRRDRQYIVEGDRVVIVDEFTGRPMPQRSWRQGLHQAIEAREGVPVTDPAETVARLSFQGFFRSFHRLGGMTGTAWEAAGEFWGIYGLPVVRIPTHRPCIRRMEPDRYFATEAAKWEAILQSVEAHHRTGRPVLVGTRSVAASEWLAGNLVARGRACQVINAVRLAEEAAGVSRAGEPGRITIATNMAGRGTDIRLGEGVAALGGLHVIVTERHESGRVDRQLVGRAARQGDPGSAQQFASAEDELVRRYLPAAARRALALAPAALGRRLVREAQRSAQRAAFRQRRAVLRADAWLEESLGFAGGGGV